MSLLSFVTCSCGFLQIMLAISLLRLQMYWLNKNSREIKIIAYLIIIQVNMPKTVVSLSELYEYKLNFYAKSLIWYKEPVTQFSTLRLQIFGKTVNAGFGNQSTLGVKQIEYHIADSLQLSSFYEKPIIVEIVNGNDGKAGGETVGYCQLNPKNITQKPIIAPILSSCCSCHKLGDIQVQFKLTRSAIDMCQLRKINNSLDNMITQCPNHFDNLYCKLRRQGYICNCKCC